MDNNQNQELSELVERIISFTGKSGKLDDAKPVTINPESFIKRAIKRLRTPRYKGIHTVYSGLNNAFRSYFPHEDPIEWQNKLANEGKIVVRPSKGGAILYLPEDAPNGFTSGKEALRKMGLA